jgi:hypothetical protein
MGDIIHRHFVNVTAKHVFAAIDACYAGMSMEQYGYLSDQADTENRLKEFRALSILRAETDNPARNLIVSGTGGQYAIWENGGIFTQALISGLNGSADYNHDGIIQFEELALYIKDEVRARASQVGQDQDPSQWRASWLGSGNVVFILGDRQNTK